MRYRVSVWSEGSCNLTLDYNGYYGYDADEFDITDLFQAILMK